MLGGVWGKWTKWVPVFITIPILLFSVARSLSERRCTGTPADGYSNDLMIAECTLLIQLGGSRKTTLAIAYNDRGVAYHGRGDYVQALADYDTSLKLDSKAVVTIVNRAFVLHDMGKYDLAIAAFDDVLKREPKKAEAYRGRGLALGAKGTHDRAGPGK